MPRLCSLVLELRIPDEANPEAVWPPGLPQDTKFPWPELGELTVANAHPDDELFAHLPQGLRTLALPSCPCKSVKECLWACEHRYLLLHIFYLLAVLDMLSVPERCPTPGLTRLGIKYGADQRDCDLVRYLPGHRTSEAFLSNSLSVSAEGRNGGFRGKSRHCFVKCSWSLKSAVASQEDVVRPSCR